MSHQPRQLLSAGISPLWSPVGPRWLTDAARVLTLLLFAAPLFVGLGRSDFGGDEAIYAYAIDGMLDHGSWLTPRSLPDGQAFLEKPPLKFWIVAGAMRLGLIGRDEAGMRVIDAVLGAIVFAYVFAMGRRLAGLVCGFVAVSVLFAVDSVVYDHGIRSNNMEAALLLAYSAGAYHFQRWVEEPAGAAKRHALAVMLAFVLAFMTKFVAAVFLPMVAIAALLWRHDGLAIARRRWREWSVPALIAALLIAPWFVYQAIVHGTFFWRVIFGEHVVTRFTAHLDPSHLQPWYYYFRLLWNEFGYAQSFTVAVAGLLTILWHAWTGRPWQARLLFVWWLLPLLLMSLMTSKLVHYVYPFVPPLAIGAGWACALAVQGIVRLAGRMQSAAQLGHRPLLRRLALVVAAAAVVLAVWTWLKGEPVTLMAGDTRLFRNSSVLRPLVIAGLLLTLIGRGAIVIGATAVMAIMMLLPITTYGPRVERVWEVNLPMHTTRTCVLSRQSDAGAARGLFVSDSGMLGRNYEYYFLPIGEWTLGSDRLVHEGRRRLFDPGYQTPVVLSIPRFHELRAALGLPPWDPRRAAAVGAARSDIVDGVLIGWDTVVLLPGPYRACVAPIIAAGAAPLWVIPAPQPR